MRIEPRPLQIGFAGASALLGLVLVYEIAAPLPDFVPPIVPLKERRTATPLPVATPSGDDYSQIDARPMFDPGRKPSAASTATAATLTPPDVALVGIILDSQDKMALLRIPGTPLAAAFHLGATISGWRLSEITPDRVVLSAGAARDEIRLDANRGEAKPAGPSSPQVPAPTAQ